MFQQYLYKNCDHTFNGQTGTVFGGILSLVQDSLVAISTRDHILSDISSQTISISVTISFSGLRSGLVSFGGLWSAVETGTVNMYSCLPPHNI